MYRLCLLYLPSAPATPGCRVQSSLGIPLPWRDPPRSAALPALTRVLAADANFVRGRSGGRAIFLTNGYTSQLRQTCETRAMRTHARVPKRVGQRTCVKRFSSAHRINVSAMYVNSNQAHQKEGYDDNNTRCVSRARPRQTGCYVIILQDKYSVTDAVCKAGSI